ncbi:hypothetical protein AAVH_16496 [Aphelenchoides avenae]|nr:hypothetical protein AAVH_16496 [Aphelenchus avenae]
MAAYPPPEGQHPPYQTQPADPYSLEFMEQQSSSQSREMPYQQPPPPATDPRPLQGMTYQQPPSQGPYVPSPSRYSQQPAGPYAQTPTRAPLQQSRSGTVSDANANDDRETPKGLVVTAVLIALSSFATTIGACIDTVRVTGSIFVVTAFSGAGCPLVLLNAFFLFAVSGVASFLTSLLVLANGARGRTRCLYGVAITFEILGSIVYFIAPAVITAMTLMLTAEDHWMVERRVYPWRLERFNGDGRTTLKEAFGSCRGQHRYSADYNTRYDNTRYGPRYDRRREIYFIGTFCDVCYKPYIVAFSLLWIFWAIGLVLRITFIVLICRATKKLPK